MPWLARSMNAPIGIDIAEDQTHIAQLRGAGSQKPRLRRHHSLEFEAGTPPIKLAEQIIQALRQEKFSGKNLVVRVPDHLLSIKNVRIPLIPDEELPEAVRWEAGERLNIDPDQSIIRYHDAGQVKQGSETRREIIILASPAQPLTELTEAFDQAGYNLLSLEATPTILLRFQQFIQQRRGNTTAVDLTPQVILHMTDRYTWVLITDEQRLVFIRQMPIGATELRQQLLPETAGCDDDEPEADTYSLDEKPAKRAEPEEAHVAQELALCLRYHGVTFPGRRPGTVWLIAPEDIADEISTAIETRTNLGVILPEEIQQTVPELMEQGHLCIDQLITTLSLAMYQNQGRKAA